MKQLGATEAARRFSVLLDNVERNSETFLVVRRGRALATIAPASGGTGSAIKDALRKHSPDPEWAEELHRLRSDGLLHKPPAEWRLSAAVYNLLKLWQADRVRSGPKPALG